MTSISPDQLSATTYAPAQFAAANRQAMPQATAVAPVSATASQSSDGYAPQAYQMTLSDASAAQQNMQTVQTQNHLIEQMNAGVAGDEV